MYATVPFILPGVLGLLYNSVTAVKTSYTIDPHGHEPGDFDRWRKTDYLSVGPLLESSSSKLHIIVSFKCLMLAGC